LKATRSKAGYATEPEYARSFADDYGYELTYLDRTGISSLLQTNRYFHGLKDKQALHIHPLNYLHALAREGERLGGTIHENSPAIRANLPSRSIRTPQGQISARRLDLPPAAIPARWCHA
jgi:gamma-glutamylputrescine oxidase